jgi:hypothetical protein
LYRHHIPTSLFRCEPMNLLPVPPCGRLVGLSATDEISLKHIAVRLEEAGENHVAAPTQNQGQDPLNIKILSKREARRRIERAPLFGQQTSSMWLLYDKACTRDSADEEERYADDCNSLVCCWENDTIADVSSRQYVEYIIILMKTRDRLLNKSDQYCM